MLAHLYLFCFIVFRFKHYITIDDDPRLSDNRLSDWKKYGYMYFKIQ